MPELPEVETVRAGLEPVMAGRRIVAAEIRRPDLRWPIPAGLADRLSGSRVEAVRRRGKYLLLDLDGGESLVIHLGMSGRILVSQPQPAARAAGAGRDALAAFAHHHPAPLRHDHVVLDIEGGARVTLNDARRFGALDLWPTADLDRHPRLAVLGPEPLGNGFHGAYLAARLAGRQAPVKAMLLDQAIVAGLGNIYVCEALWRAGISPLRPAGRISREEAEALAGALRAVLTEAIAAGGSSLRDHRRTDGALGYFQHGFAVYGRAGAPCPRPGCGGTVERRVQSGRSSFQCPRCQRA
jgi:formamidopyrimidine-DNA glycosylase